MGWRGLRSLRDATRFMLATAETPYPIDQESGRKAEHDLGWDGEVSRRVQSRSEVRHIQSTKRRNNISLSSIPLRF